MSSFLDSIQQQIADLLTADPAFATLVVVPEVIGDLQSEYDKAMGTANAENSKVGAIVIVHTPSANVSLPDMFGPFFDEVSVAIEVGFNPELANGDNGVGGSALGLCESVCNVLAQSFPASANGPLSPLKPTIVLEGKNDEGVVVHTVNFRTNGGIRAVPPQLPPVAVNETGGVISLSVATPGAAIFYTLDGSNASPRNPTSALYTAPFTPGSGLTLKARAWLAGYQAGAITTQIT